MYIYNYIFCKIYYPYGYRTETQTLPDYIHLEIKTEKSSKVLYVHSKIHVNKCVKVGPSYSLEWKDNEIINDLSGDIARRFGV